MSHLLDALRKTEELKKRGPAPTIYSAERHDSQATGTRWFGMVLLVLIPLLVLLAWYSWTHRGDGSELTTGGSDSGTAVNMNPATPGTRPENQLAPSSQVNRDTTTANVRLTTNRTPVETLASQAIESAAPETGSPAAQDAVNSDADIQLVESTDTDMDTRSRSSNTGGAALSRDDAGSSGQALDFDPGLPGLIHVWELPESVRSDLMEMNISVLVYAEQPENRFLLMNNKRWVEGDEPQDGLRIEEIQRGGVVFRFRRYRFLVDR